MDLNTDVANLSRDELEEECLHLQRKCKQLCDGSEADAQLIYELKRNLETVTAAQSYLAQELELTVKAQEECVDIKLQKDQDELRRKYHELSTEFAALQDKYETISMENTKLLANLQTLNAEKEKSSDAISQDFYERLTERLNVLEQENMELLQKLDEQHADKMQQTMAIAEKEKKIELMQDEVSCLEENMRCKREELEEKTGMLESAQEQLFEANCKINMLMGTPDNKDRKGNSLFAEVDDQRQAMKQLLATQKKSFQEMKKIYNESQYEIRRLKRENSAMHTELQACSLIFCSADRTYQENLNNRIEHLLDQNEYLEQKLKWIKQHLKDLASDRGFMWMDSTLNFCKEETDDMKKQLRSFLIKNADLEEQLRKVQQDMVRWRFEALKSRCLLIDRENLLTDHKIDFKPQNEVEYKVTITQEKTARPRIVPSATANTSISISSTPCMNKRFNQSCTASELSEEKISQPVESTNLNSPLTICLDDSIECNKEKSASPVIKVECSPPPAIKSEVHVRKILQEINPQIPVKSVENLNKEKEQDLKQNQFQPSKLPSILCKNREIISINAEKNVKFATNEATVYNLPVNPDTVVEAKIDNAGNDNILKGEKFAESNVKITRTKSNVIVRHFVVGSKRK